MVRPAGNLAAGDGENGFLDLGHGVVADLLVVVGSLGHLIGEEALRLGMKPETVFFAADNAQVVDYLRRVLKQGDHVLVKGSRGLHMEEIVDGLKPSRETE